MAMETSGSTITERRLRSGDGTGVEGVLREEQAGQAGGGQGVGRPAEKDVGPSAADLVVHLFMRAAVKAKAMAAATPNTAAFQAGDPTRVSMTEIVPPPMTAMETRPQS